MKTFTFLVLVFLCSCKKSTIEPKKLNLKPAISKADSLFAEKALNDKIIASSDLY